MTRSISVGAAAALALCAACHTPCSRGDSRCQGNAVEACNYEQTDWTAPTSCSTPGFPNASCISLGPTSAFCALGASPVAECAADGGVACFEGYLVGCYAGYPVGNGVPQSPTFEPCVEDGGEG